MRFRTLLWRSCRLRCPLCGQGRLFENWFRMRPQCPHCDGDLQREGGFYLGSIYFNYGLTALIVAIAYPVLLFNRVLPSHVLLPLALVFVVLFPIWFFRYARSLWLGFDQYWDPRQGEQGTSHSGSA
ncbi:MAG: DUF983 domain-containing protein [Pirellulaceae bacterium]|nr:DUF983 domain-containing protein [Pirellulaceae bacterium]